MVEVVANNDELFVVSDGVPFSDGVDWDTVAYDAVVSVG